MNRINRREFAGAALAALGTLGTATMIRSVSAAAGATPPQLNPRLLTMPDNSWLNLRPKVGESLDCLQA